MLLYHALRRSELCALRVKDLGLRRGLMHLSVHGKRGKWRYIPVHPKALALVQDLFALHDSGGVEIIYRHSREVDAILPLCLQQLQGPAF